MHAEPSQLNLRKDSNKKEAFYVHVYSISRLDTIYIKYSNSAGTGYLHAASKEHRRQTLLLSLSKFKQIR